MSGLELVAERPVPGHPRPYEFPDDGPHRASRTACGSMVTPMPGRALIAASLVIRAGAGDEPAERGGATVLGARALTEGTEVRDAIALTEAAERLGASIHAEAGWDATFAGLDVPASRLGPALELLAEVLRRPAFPEREVDRLRDERLTDLLQAKADPRRRAEEAFVDAIYAPSSPYHRPAGGSADTVETLTAAELRAVYERNIDPARAAIVVAGEVDPDAVIGIVEGLFADWSRSASAVAPGPIDDTSAVAARFVNVVHRPGAVQTEIRVGPSGPAAPPPGLPRGVRDERDPRRAVQLPAEHEPARGEGLHVRRQRRASTCGAPAGRSRRGPPSTPRSPSRRCARC